MQLCGDKWKLKFLFTLLSSGSTYTNTYRGQSAATDAAVAAAAVSGGGIAGAGFAGIAAAAIVAVDAHDGGGGCSDGVSKVLLPVLVLLLLVLLLLLLLLLPLLLVLVLLLLLQLVLTLRCRSAAGRAPDYFSAFVLFFLILLFFI